MKSIQSTLHKSLGRSLIVCALFSSLSLLTIANAEEYNYDRSGGLFNNYYLGGAIGQSTANDYCNGASSCEDSDTAWKLFGGYEVINKVSAEASYLNLGDIRQDGENSDISAFALHAVGTLPVTQRFDAFAKLGGTYWDSENSQGDESGFGLSYGLGAKMTFNETTKIRAEWEKLLNIDTGSDDADISVLTISVEFSTL